MPQRSLPVQGPVVRAAKRYLTGLLVCLLSIPGCGTPNERARTETAGQPLPTIDAVVIDIRPQPWPQIVRSQGSLVADDVALIGSRVEGSVQEVHVDLGDTVSAGAPLVTLNQAEFRLRVAQAEAQLRQSRSAVGLEVEDDVGALNPENSPPVLEQKAVWVEATASLERARQLQARNSITAGEFEQLAAAAAVAEARYKSAVNGVHEKIALIGVRQAELSLAQESLANTVIVAPFDGFLQQRQASPGTFIRVGDPLVTLVRTEVLRFRGTVPERFALAMSEGQIVKLYIESVPDPLEVRVTRISPSLDMLSRSLLFEAEVDNSDHRFRTGLFTEAQIVVNDQAEALVIPKSALSEFAGAEKVWRVTDGECREREVLTGERRGDRIEILQGLSVGDVVLLNANEGLLAKVQPIRTGNAVADRSSGEISEKPAN